MQSQQYRKNIAHNLKVRRKMLEISQQGLGETIGRDRGWISAIESGTSGVDFDEVPAIAAALKIKNPLVLLEEQAFCEVEVGSEGSAIGSSGG